MKIVATILFLVFTIVSGILAYFYLRYNKFKEFDKTYSLINDQDCSLLDLPGAPEDFVLFQNRFIISAVNDNINYFQNAQYQTTPNGKFVIIDTQNPTQPYVVQMSSFPPKGVTFHPHGMFLDPQRNLIYVISHSYMNGGERIEIFEILELPRGLHIIHKRSLILPSFLMGVSNDLIVLDKGKTIFVTKFLPIPDPQTGRDTSCWANYERWIKIILGGYTEVYQCEVKKDSDKLKCEVFLEGGDEYNGIEWDQKRSTIYVADVVKSEVRAVEIDKSSKSIKKITDYKVKHHPDNLVLIGDMLYAGVYVSRAMHDEALKAISEEGRDFTSCKHPGGGVRLNLNTGEVEEVVIQDILFGSTLLLPIQNGEKKSAFIGSWGKHAIAICNLN